MQNCVDYDVIGIIYQMHKKKKSFDTQKDYYIKIGQIWTDNDMSSHVGHNLMIWHLTWEDKSAKP